MKAAAALTELPAHWTSTQWWLEALASALWVAGEMGPYPWVAPLMAGVAGKALTLRRPRSAAEEAAQEGFSLVEAEEVSNGGVASIDY